MKNRIIKKVWGYEELIVNREYCGKKLVLKKGFRCSIHHHKIKDETFYIIKGKVLIELNNKKQILVPGDSVLIKPGEKHRFTGLEYSEIIEFSTHHKDSDSYRDSESGPVDLKQGAGNEK
ncbi:MAG: cupin domain-containing protein [Nanoarchaeota archaeon]